MGAYWRSGLVKIGLALLVFGVGPLVAIVFLAHVGSWPDPNPNPVGPGLLACMTFWPGVICLIVGAIRFANRERVSRGAE